MNKCFVACLLLFYCSSAAAQQAYLDSCLQALQLHKGEDSNRLKLLNEIAFEYHYSDPDKGLTYAEQAVALAKALNHHRLLASAYSYTGVNYAAKGYDSIALRMYAYALAIHTQMKNKKGVASALNNMAIIYVNKGNYAEALKYHARVLEVFKQLGDKSRIATALNNTGVVYLYMADYPRALDYYLRALTIQEKLGQNVMLANNLMNIGIIYKNIHDYTNALAFHNRALELYEKLNMKQGVADVLGNIGVAYDNSGRSGKALEYYTKALAINRQIGNNTRIAGNLTNIGIVYQGMGQYRTSLDYFQQALQLYERTGDKNNTTTVLNQLAKIYLEAPDTTFGSPGLKDRFAQAGQYLNRALNLARSTGAPDRQSEIWESMSKLYTERNEYDKALHAYQQHVLFRDSVHNVEMEKQITRQVMQFEFEKKEALAASEIGRQRLIKNVLLAGGAILLVTAVITFLFYKRKRDAEEHRKEAEMLAEAAGIEMKALRLQMNPHFIFSSLNSISDFITKNNIPQADYYLARFARLMRMILENSEQRMVSLAADLEALQLYLQLEALRLNQKFTWEISVQDTIDKENTLVPPLLLQPFVENSIIHGMPAGGATGKILVRIEERNRMLCCIVEDNGPGFDQHATPKESRHGINKRSLGLKITRERISLISKTGPDEATLHITAMNPGTRATIMLPLELRF